MVSDIYGQVFDNKGLMPWKDREYRNKYYRDHRARLKAAGICRDCAGEALPGKALCRNCYDRQYRNIRNKGIALRKEVYDFYGSICACCGEDNLGFLSIDHINNDGYKERKHYKKNGKNYQQGSGWELYIKLHRLIKAGTPRKDLQLLCFNCNLGKARNEGICPHKKAYDCC